MKRFWAAMLAVLVLAGFASFAAAGDVQGSREPVIQDDAGLLKESEKTALREVMAGVSTYGTPVFWTTKESGDYRRKAERMYTRLLGNGSGILFVIDMNERVLTILTNGAILKVISPSEADTITDNVYRMAGRGEYAACAEEVFRQAKRLLEGEQIARPMKITSNALLAVTIALLLLWLRISYHYENKAKTGKKTAPLPVTAAGAAAFSATLSDSVIRMTKQTKTRIDGGGRGGFGRGGFGGGFGGGGGGGGGFSGGGGSHRF